MNITTDSASPGLQLDSSLERSFISRCLETQGQVDPPRGIAREPSIAAALVRLAMPYTTMETQNHERI